MPVYSKVINDEAILDLLSKNNTCHSILILGCGGCMNESLAYDGDLCIYKDGTESPCATITELNRIRKLLGDHHYSVIIKHFDGVKGFLCMDNVDDNDYGMNLDIQPDIILVLSCLSGHYALKNRLPKSNIICITEIKGGLSYYFKDEEGTRFIVKEKSKITPME